MQRFFRLAAIGAGVATGIHLGAFLFPALNLYLYSATYPAWRHLAWCVINPALGWLFLTRPTWSAWVYCLVTMQVYYSHGGSLVRRMASGGGVRWLDVVAVLGSTVVVIMMLLELRQRRRLLRPAGLPEELS
jgi:hypothetical protein